MKLTDTNWSTGLFFLAIQLFTWELILSEIRVPLKVVRDSGSEKKTERESVC